MSPGDCVHKTYDVPPNNEANVEIEQSTQETPAIEKKLAETPTYGIDQNVIPSVTLQPIHEEENCDGDTDSFHSCCDGDTDPFHSCTHVFICFYHCLKILSSFFQGE